jgi:ABC-type antimicrobial peptide transport system permease subunit
VLATRTALRDERTLIAEYEALGVPPRSLARSVQIRLATLSALGLAAGGVGGVLTVALIGTYVAVTASGTRPLPSVEPAVAWTAGAVVLVGLATTAAIAAAWLAGRDLRRSVAARLRG